MHLPNWYITAPILEHDLSLLTVSIGIRAGYCVSCARLEKMFTPLLILAGIAAAAVVDLESRQSASQITTVDLSVNWGAPVRRASGTIPNRTPFFG